MTQSETIPPEVQTYIDVLDKYQTNEDLQEFTLFHLYPQDGFAYPDGYFDSKMFILNGYNSKVMQKRDLGRHDGLTIEKAQADMVRIFADGSTIIRFKYPVKVWSGQDATILPVSGER